MNTKKLKELIELMTENGLTELEVELEGMKVRLVKGYGGRVEHFAVPLTHQAAHMPASPQVAQPAGEPQKKGKEVKAPMVGTFYRAPSPDADPFVEVGDTVSKGDVICIIEAMKLMNEVKAEFGGRIIEILVENAEPVEFGQTMFLVEAQ